MENKELKSQFVQANSVVDSMWKFFSDGQIRKLMGPGNVFWKWRNKSSAICLHASGPRAYQHLYRKGFPPPHFRRLQRWCGKVTLHEGIPSTKICVLTFNEMKVEKTYEYDSSTDIVRKPTNYVQVVMARGPKKYGSSLYIMILTAKCRKI